MAFTSAVKDNADNMQQLIKEGLVYCNDYIDGGVRKLSEDTTIEWKAGRYIFTTQNGNSKDVSHTRLWIKWCE